MACAVPRLPDRARACASQASTRVRSPGSPSSLCQGAVVMEEMRRSVKRYFTNRPRPTAAGQHGAAGGWGGWGLGGGQCPPKAGRLQAARSSAVAAATAPPSMLAPTLRRKSACCAPHAPAMDSGSQMSVMPSATLTARSPRCGAAAHTGREHKGRSFGGCSWFVAHRCYIPASCAGGADSLEKSRHLRPPRGKAAARVW